MSVKTNPSALTGNNIVVTADFTSTEINFLKQGVAKVIRESRNHSADISGIRANSVDSDEVSILQYYSRRIEHCSALLKRLEFLQEQIDYKKNNSVAHNA